MRRAALLVLFPLFAFGCAKETPTEPETRPVLVLAYSGGCGTADSALVTIDGVAVGRVRVPGATSFLIEPGPHQVQVGSSPAFAIQMPSDRDLGLTDVPSPCP